MKPKLIFITILMIGTLISDNDRITKETVLVFSNIEIETPTFIGKL